jgi:hypothetical protein
MAMMQPLSGLTEFIAVLSALERGEDAGFPIYCALLFTVEEGLDEQIARYVGQHWNELDDMTGDDCLVFVVGDRDAEQVIGGRRFAAREVYSIARELGARADALPCACFFVDPAASREVLRVRLRDYLPPLETRAQDDLTRGFRGIGAALQTCAGRDSPQRLQCLRGELIEQHRRLTGGGDVPDPENRDRAESFQRVLASGASIASSVATVLGLVL